MTSSRIRATVAGAISRMVTLDEAASAMREWDANPLDVTKIQIAL